MDNKRFLPFAVNVPDKSVVTYEYPASVVPDWRAGCSWPASLCGIASSGVCRLLYFLLHHVGSFLLSSSVALLGLLHLISTEQLPSSLWQFIFPWKIILFPPTFCHACLPGLSPLNHTPWFTCSKTPPLCPAQTNNGNLIITVLEMAMIPDALSVIWDFQPSYKEPSPSWSYVASCTRIGSDTSCSQTQPL